MHSPSRSILSQLLVLYLSSHIHSHLDNLCPMHFPSELVSLWNFTSSAGPWLLRSWIRFGYDWSATNGKEGPNPVKKHSISRSEKVRILTSLRPKVALMPFGDCLDGHFAAQEKVFSFLWFFPGLGFECC